MGTLMPMTELRGILTAMATPFDARGGRRRGRRAGAGSPSCSRTARTGWSSPATTGESTTLDDAEHIGALRAVVDEVGGEAPIVCGTGTNDTRHSIELTKAAAAAGAEAALVVTPYYNKPNPAGIRAHFEAVAAAVPDLPLIVYNIPSRVIVNVSPSELAELAKIDNVVARQAGQQRRPRPDRRDGGAGRQRRHLLPHARARARRRHHSSPRTWSARRCARSGTRSQAGDLERAREIDAGLRPLYEALAVTTNPMPIKAAMEMTRRDSVRRHAAADGASRRRRSARSFARRWRASE